MAIDKKRAEKARKNQLEGFLNTQPENGQEESKGSIEAKRPADKPKQKPRKKADLKKSAPEYIRLDVSGFKEYLQTMAGYDSIRYGKTVSVTKYIRTLISEDMASRKKEYQKVKKM